MRQNGFIGAKVDITIDYINAIIAKVLLKQIGLLKNLPLRLKSTYLSSL